MSLKNSLMVAWSASWVSMRVKSASLRAAEADVVDECRGEVDEATCDESEALSANVASPMRVPMKMASEGRMRNSMRSSSWASPKAQRPEW